jgi:hypothetical protein
MYFSRGGCDKRLLLEGTLVEQVSTLRFKPMLVRMFKLC